MRILLVTFLFLLVGCASQQVDTPEMQRAYEKMKQQIENKDLEVFVNAANPLSNQDIANLGLLPAGSTANRILLNGDEYFKLKGDRVSVHLPFYGTQQLPMEYMTGGPRGFQFDELPYEDYKHEFNEKKKLHTLKFKVKNDKESLTIFVKLFRNAKANIYINSSHRTAINYDGKLQLKE